MTPAQEAALQRADVQLQISDNDLLAIKWVNEHGWSTTCHLVVGSPNGLKAKLEEIIACAVLRAEARMRACSDEDDTKIIPEPTKRS